MVMTVPDFTVTAPHLHGIADLCDGDIETLLGLADFYADQLRHRRPVVPRLSGRTQINLFFEDSTRTNMSFEVAGRKLGADVIVVPVAASSVNKNEDMIDTVQTLAAMAADIMIIRTREPGIHEALAERIGCPIINAGDGAHEHPTQALLDALTIQSACGRIDGLTIAICGDVRHSRVAGSGARLLQRLGADVRFVGPPALLPDAEAFPGIAHAHTLADGLQGADIVMALRVQFERLEDNLAVDRSEFHSRFAITYDTLSLAKPGAYVMHPGPMNRGIEIEARLADDPERSLILAQVFHGVAMRMAVLDGLINRSHKKQPPARSYI